MDEWLFRHVSYLRTPWCGVAWGLVLAAMGAAFLAERDGVGYLEVGGGAIIVLLGIIGRRTTGSWRRQGKRWTLDDVF